MTDGTKNADSALSLFMGTHDTIHQALVVNAVSKTKLMADFMAHYVTAAHQMVFMTVRIFDQVPLRIKAAERKGTNSFSEASPAETENPARIREQIFHC